MRYYKTLAAATLVVISLLQSRAAAQVKLPSIISDHMILQRGQQLPIWGWDARVQRSPWRSPARRPPQPREKTASSSLGYPN